MSELLILTIVFLVSNSLLCIFSLFFSHLKDKEKNEMIKDLLNRKMARDFFEYANGINIIKNKQPQQPTLFEKEIDIPPFINQPHPPQSLQVGGNFGG